MDATSGSSALHSDAGESLFAHWQFIDANTSHIDKAENNQAIILVQQHDLYTESLNSAEQLLKTYQGLSHLGRFYTQLRGAFLIYIYDKSAEQHVIFNDAIGCIPGYYCPSKMLLSSSLKTLKSTGELPTKISNQALYHYIYFHCIPSPLTIYDTVYKLEPGKAMIIDEQSNISEKLLYQPSFSAKANNVKQLKTKCLSLMEKAVNRVRHSQSGAFLSGGLDSSTVAGMMAKGADKANTFSIGFEHKDYDETAYAQISAEHFNTVHRVKYLTAPEAAQSFVKVAQYFDEPFGNSSAMATYFCARFAKQHGITRLLAGDGGDELFAGNERYAKQKQFQLYHYLPTPLQRCLDYVCHHRATQKLPLVRKAKSYIRQVKMGMPERLQSYNFVHLVGADTIFCQPFLDSVEQSLPQQQLKQRYQQTDSDHMVDKMLFLDWKFTLADNDLIKVNKMCELAGVEVRFPLLDKELVDFSCQIPASVKLPGNKLRDFFKQTVRGFLADDTLTKSKHGFGLPFGVWLKQDQQLKEIAEQALEAFKQRHIVRPEFIEHAVKAHQDVHAGYYGELIWILVVLELWLQKEEA